MPSIFGLTAIASTLALAASAEPLEQKQQQLRSPFVAAADDFSTHQGRMKAIALPVVILAATVSALAFFNRRQFLFAWGASAANCSWVLRFGAGVGILSVFLLPSSAWAFGVCSMLYSYALISASTPIFLARSGGAVAIASIAYLYLLLGFPTLGSLGIYPALNSCKAFYGAYAAESTGDMCGHGWYTFLLIVSTTILCLIFLAALAAVAAATGVEISGPASGGLSFGSMALYFTLPASQWPEASARRDSFEALCAGTEAHKASMFFARLADDAGLRYAVGGSSSTAKSGGGGGDGHAFDVGLAFMEGFGAGFADFPDGTAPLSTFRRQCPRWLTRRAAVAECLTKAVTAFGGSEVTAVRALGAALSSLSASDPMPMLSASTELIVYRVRKALLSTSYPSVAATNNASGLRASVSLSAHTALSGAAPVTSASIEQWAVAVVETIGATNYAAAARASIHAVAFAPAATSSGPRGSVYIGSSQGPREAALITTTEKAAPAPAAADVSEKEKAASLRAPLLADNDRVSYGGESESDAAPAARGGNGGYGSASGRAGSLQPQRRGPAASSANTRHSYHPSMLAKTEEEDGGYARAKSDDDGEAEVPPAPMAEEAEKQSSSSPAEE